LKKFDFELEELDPKTEQTHTAWPLAKGVFLNTVQPVFPGMELACFS